MAGSPAATITGGLDVFVQVVIAAITRRPWSTAVRVPSSRVTPMGFEGRVPPPGATGSEAGNVPARPLSRVASGT